MWIIDFDDHAVDTAGPCAAGVTGRGGASAWSIRADPASPVGGRHLAQTTTLRVDDRFPLCLFDLPVAGDVDVSVRFRAVSGQIDRAAGLIVRARDGDNYYVVRANALEDNVRFYRVVGGRRTQIAGAEAKVTTNAWHTLRLTALGRGFTVEFDGRRLFAAEDATFAGAGRVGLWTKADSATDFDDVRIATPPD
ncbi:MAG: hypothetical protein ACKVSF_13400 [Alphaproteobacteria bacterium]